MIINGAVISGEFDQPSNEFSLQKIKHFYTESTLKENQVNTLYEYLTKHKDDVDGQVITLYDQMPIHLSQSEIIQIIADLEKIRTLYH
ncbi:hypothetical protein [Halalkalibacter urbisdiaboli]|uniref:hypothetical protein n=1 Tax=Halalkalibacter urbisdiaboli TaxID=1960589 RepID=UPI000B432100|nr:hypothetical protein [Halalkalibacter urbisdiaboli]